jgi:hypothetical protein
MLRSHRPLYSAFAAIVSLGCAAQGASAAGRVVNNIWWDLVINWRNSGQTVCIAEQHNPYTVTAYFDVYPVYDNPIGSRPPRHETIKAIMKSYKFNRIYGWLDSDRPNPQCVLKSWSTTSRRLRRRR